MERKKKSRKELVLEQIEERGLVSYMNTTKWKELQNAIDDLPFPPPYVLKDVCKDEANVPKFDEDVSYWGLWSDEGLCWGHYFAIEWIKVRPRYTRHRGQLVEPEIIEITDEFVEILKKYNIPYEEENGVYTIYGYRGA